MWTPNSEPLRGRPQVVGWQPNGAAFCGRIWTTTREGVGFQFRGGSLAGHLSACGGGRKAVVDFHLNADGGGTWAANVDGVGRPMWREVDRDSGPKWATNVDGSWTSIVEGGGPKRGAEVDGGVDLSGRPHWTKVAVQVGGGWTGMVARHWTAT